MGGKKRTKFCVNRRPMKDADPLQKDPDLKKYTSVSMLTARLKARAAISLLHTTKSDTIALFGGD